MGLPNPIQPYTTFNFRNQKTKDKPINLYVISTMKAVIQLRLPAPPLGDPKYCCDIHTLVMNEQGMISISHSHPPLLPRIVLVYLEPPATYHMPFHSSRKTSMGTRRGYRRLHLPDNLT